MCKNPLCLQLREALNAAFSREPLQTDPSVEAWVHGFMKALQELTRGKLPRRLHTASGKRNSLIDILRLAL
jgi:hypothetical protein